MKDGSEERERKKQWEEGGIKKSCIKIQIKHENCLACFENVKMTTIYGGASVERGDVEDESTGNENAREKRGEK